MNDYKQTEEFQLDLVCYGCHNEIVFDSEPTNPVLHYVYHLRNKDIDYKLLMKKEEEASEYTKNILNGNYSEFEKETMFLIRATLGFGCIDKDLPRLKSISECYQYSRIYNYSNFIEDLKKTTSVRERLRCILFYTILFIPKSTNDTFARCNNFLQEILMKRGERAELLIDIVKEFYDHYNLSYTAVGLAIMHHLKCTHPKSLFSDKERNESLFLRNYYMNKHFKFIKFRMLRSNRGFDKINPFTEYIQKELLEIILDMYEQQIERIDELETQIRYSPGGEGMLEAKESFESMCETIDKRD